jgi:Phosphotransferase system mannitol/fructose-specific IIA domain (Ntr-type)
MNSEFDIAELIHKGGVYDNVEGETPESVYEKISTMIPLPQDMSAEAVYDALAARERVLSTAVGNGIALPHARAPIMKSVDDQRICIVYLKNPLDMKAPDERKVFVMFVLLTFNSQSHLRILSSLVTLFRKTQFRKLLEKHAGEAELLNAIRELD